MIPFTPAVVDEVRALVQGVDSSNFDSTHRELCQLADCSPDGCMLLLRVCLDEVMVNVNVAKSFQSKHDLLRIVFKYCLGKPYFGTSFCEALKTVQFNDLFLETFSNELGLSAGERVIIGLALSDSENLGLILQGQKFAISHIEELCANPTHVLSNDQIHEIVVFLHQTDGLSKHMDSFTNIISLLKVKERPFYVPDPIKEGNARSTVSSRHMELYNGSLDDDFDSLLSEIGKEISMADIITELGYGCTSDVAHCKEILSLFEPLDDMGISKLLGAVVCTRVGLGEAQSTYSTFLSAVGNSQSSDSSQFTAWNVDVLVDSINEIAPRTNWITVVENLDHEGFCIPDEAAFRLLMSIYSRACKDPFPLHAVCGSLWKNTEGQLSFLKHAVAAPADTFTFKHCSRTMVFPELANRMQDNQAWYCLDLLEVLCQLAELGYATMVRSILDYPLVHCPDVLLLGVSHVNTAYNLLQYEVLSCVFPVIMKDSTYNSLMNSLWHVNPYLTLRGFVDSHSDINCLLRTVEICQDLTILSAVLDSTPFAFSIKLATFAFRQNHSNLEKWLVEKLSAQGEPFLEHQKVLSNILKPWFRIFAENPVLQSHSGQLLSNQLVEELRRVEAVHESRSHGAVGRDIPTSEAGPDDIEAQANIYFHQMFSGQISVDAMVQMLARFKESTNKRELSIFNCMVSNLFEEYKFFPKYPDTQLKLAAVLMGSLIKHQLVAHLGLGIALRSVLDALRKSIDSKMFMFGTTALEQFMDRLIEWPQYCNHILQISHLRATHAELVAAIERALAKISSSQNEPNVGSMLSADQHGSSSIGNIEASEASWQLINPTPTQLERPHQQRHQGFLGERSKGSTNIIQAKNILSSGQTPLASAPGDLAINLKAATPPSSQASPHHSTTISAPSQPTGFLRSRSSAPSGIRQPSFNTGFGAALNIETLVAAAERRDTPIEAPPSEVQDKIFFMINNISTSNMEAKAREFNEVLQEQYYPWFAQYMVMKRASIEPNFHDLYLKFFDKVNSKSLNKEMVKATYENCKVLLQSDLIKSSSEERSLLKNLGSWLGKFTIGRNQTLRAKEIDPKILIIEAYERGLMIAVIPFTSKVLFKNLSVDMKDVKPSSLLKDRNRQFEGNPDFSNKDVSASQTPVVAEVSSGVMPTINHAEPQPEINSTSRATSLPNMLSQYAAPLRLPPNSMVEDDKAALIMPEQFEPGFAISNAIITGVFLMAAIPRADIYFRINEKLNSFGSLQYSKIMDMALDKAIKEIIGPVIQRSVTIASRTTKELILKDYAMESDDSAVSRSAHLMVGTLAGSLAHVTSKEPLRVALSSHLRSIIQGITNNSESTEQIINILVNDNLDLGCALIETVATRKAVEMIDGEIKQPFSQLRRQKELLGSAYYDAIPYTQGLKRVPDALRPKPAGHLSAAQRRVYEDFITVWHSQSSQNAGATAAATAMAVAPSNSGVPRVYSPNSALPDSSSFSTLNIAPFASASQSTELVHEESDRSATQLPSLSAKIGTSDTSTQVIGTTNVASIFPPMVPNDLPVGEPTSVNKDLVSSAPLSPTTAVDRMGSVFAEPLNTGDALERYQQVSQKLDALIAKDGKDVEIQKSLTSYSDVSVEMKLHWPLHRRSLCDNAANSVYVTCLLAALVAIRDVCKLVVKELTSWVIYSDEDKKFNIEIIVGLIRSELLNLGDYNVHLAKIIDGGRNKAATEFAISLVQTLITQESISISEVYNVVDALSKLAIRPSSPESLQQLIEIARSFAAMKDENIRLSRDKKVAVSFSEWCNICDHPTMGDSAYTHYIVQHQQDGLLKGDELTDRFFHILTELAVAHSVVSEQVVAPGGISQQPTQQLQISYFSIDSYSKLVALVVKYFSVDLGPSKGSLFNKVLTAFANAFHVLQPLRVPAWSFAWLELVSHRSFMPKLLLCNAQKGWPFFQRLLVDLFKFMEPYLRNAELGQPIHLLYKGTLRVLLVLLHDFPEFLCDYHFSFCDVIPPSCIQMRNVILSAFPRNMRLPDPSTPNLKIDLLAEIAIPPRIMSDVDGALKSKQLKTQVDEYLKRPEGSFLTDLKQKLLLPQNEANIAGTRYNVPLAVQQLQLNKLNASASAQQMNQNPLDVQIETATELFRNLVMNSDTEGRYLLLNAIANQLRYPNNHTHYFSFIILYLFSEATQEIVQEQITRVLLERLIVNRPHPWGLLITFIELIKNPRYSFWARSFTRCAPEIEKLFESVARSCGGKAGDDGVGLTDGGH
uniref:CCR4-Not complex component Not1 C-terminal domain-containing protein n=1 Tax=Leersia perrieri TaxID=77586 RepID=A0A0D9XMB8_9ORYZ